MTESKTKIEFNVLDVIGNLSLAENNNAFFILNKKENTEESKKDLNQCTYYSKVLMNGEWFELLEFRNMNVSVVKKIFELMSEIGKGLPKSIDEIRQIFSKFEKNISFELKRGVFAELYTINNFGLTPKSTKNSIYDMIDQNNNDVEIKSYSKVKREIKLSYQQLTNNSKANLLMMEISESSAGQTLFELFNLLDADAKKRYYWISDNMKEKFIVSNKGKLDYIPMEKIASNISLPKNYKDAIFTFDVDAIFRNI